MKPRRTLKPVAERHGAIIDYQIILTAMLRDIRAEYRTSVLPAYKQHRQYTADELAWFERLKSRTAGFIDTAIAAADSLFSVEALSFTRRFGRTVAAGAGVRVGDVHINIGRREARVMADVVAKNAGLIKSLGDDATGRVQRIILDGKLNNTPAAEISRHIQRDFKILKRRADLIAADQLSSLNSDLTAMHHKAVGVTEYVWVTRRDESVRGLHQELHGKVYKHGSPTGAENGLPPGKPIRCRCVAEAILPNRRNFLAEILVGVAGGLAVGEAFADDPDDEE